MQTILVTGGAGYIGSHTVLQLLEAGNQVIVLDNLCNSSQESLKRVEELTGKSTIFVQGDIRDHTILELLFSKHKINAVIHFAGLKAVGESVEKPLNYYNNNVYGTLKLCELGGSLGGVQSLVLGGKYVTNTLVLEFGRFSVTCRRLWVLFVFSMFLLSLIFVNQGGEFVVKQTKNEGLEFEEVRHVQ